jgi:hypothetical protein
MKGIASPIGPESCVPYREVLGEALTGVPVGQVLSRESSVFRDADTVRGVEGSMGVRVIASAPPVPRGLRPWHVGKPFVWEPGDLMSGRLVEGRSVLGRLEGRSQ